MDRSGGFQPPFSLRPIQTRRLEAAVTVSHQSTIESALAQLRDLEVYPVSGSFTSEFNEGDLLAWLRYCPRDAVPYFDAAIGAPGGSGRPATSRPCS